MRFTVPHRHILICGKLAPRIKPPPRKVAHVIPGHIPHLAVAETSSLVVALILVAVKHRAFFAIFR
jgi:hypothetical protein